MVERSNNSPERLLQLADGDTEGARLAVLRLLERQPDISIRAASRELGLSMGKTHYVLRALLDKGLVKARNFQRSDRKWTYAYVLTPSGLKERVRLTRSFLSRKEAEYEALAHAIETLKGELDGESRS